MSCTQGSTFIEKVNQTYNANDRNKAKHIEIDRMNDYMYIE